MGIQCKVVLMDAAGPRPALSGFKQPHWNAFMSDYPPGQRLYETAPPKPFYAKMFEPEDLCPDGPNIRIIHQEQTFDA
jgi:hypothetical protein